MSAQQLEAQQRPTPFAATSDEDLATKKILAEAPKRKSHVRTASTAGDVQSVLAFLETIQDPKEATALALDAHKYLTRYRHASALKLLEQECDGIFGHQNFQALAENGGGSGMPGPPPVRYDHNTAQIVTGKIGSIRLHMDRGCQLPIKDGTAGSSDPFVRIKLWEGKGGHRRCVRDTSTQIKIMTLNPVFDEFFVLDVNTPDCELELTAYDWDGMFTRTAVLWGLCCGALRSML